MDPIELLVSEHRMIEAAMDALEVYVDRLDAGARPADLGRFVTFLREFADTCHHGKEEDILFAAMVEAGFPRESGPIAVMLADHDDGRSHVRALADLSTRAGAWTADDRQSIVTHARAFTALLRAHIQKEDHILYPMARRNLPDTSMALVASRVDRFQRQQADAGRHESLVALAEDLAHRYGAPPSANVSSHTR